jgi:hypothetical protein
MNVVKVSEQTIESPAPPAAHNSDVNVNTDEERYLEDDLEDDPKRYLFIHGEYIHINDIIESGVQFETMDDMFNWRLQILEEMKSWPCEESNNFEFPFLVCKSARRFMCPGGCIRSFSRYLD